MSTPDKGPEGLTDSERNSRVSLQYGTERVGEYSPTLGELYNLIPEDYRRNILRCTGPGTALIPLLAFVFEYAEWYKAQASPNMAGNAPKEESIKEESPEYKAIRELAARQTNLDPDMQDVLNRTSDRLSRKPIEEEKPNKCPSDGAASFYPDNAPRNVRYYHDIHCSANPFQPMGNEGCSCSMYQRARKSEKELASAREEVAALLASNKEWEEKYLAVEKEMLDYRKALEFGRIHGIDADILNKYPSPTNTDQK
jgi:hypothetical protein